MQKVSRLRTKHRRYRGGYPLIHTHFFVRGKGINDGLFTKASYPFQIQSSRLRSQLAKQQESGGTIIFFHRVAQRSRAFRKADVEVLIEPEIQHQVEPCHLTKIIFVGLDHADFAEQIHPGYAAR